MNNPGVVSCRFCHDEGTEEEPLFYPCKCTGSIKYIHKTCLDEWLKHSKNMSCEICKQKYTYRLVYNNAISAYMPLVDTFLQMFSRVYPPIRKIARVVFVITMWLFVLPYTVYWNIKLASVIANFIFNGTGSPLNSEQPSDNKDFISGMIHSAVVVFLRSSIWILKLIMFDTLPSDSVEVAFNICVNVATHSISGWIPTIIGLSAWPFAKQLYEFLLSKYDFYNPDNDSCQHVVHTFEEAAQELMNMGNIFDNNIRNLDEMERLMHEIQQLADELPEAQNANIIHINANWRHFLGIHILNRNVAKFYLKCIVSAHFTIVALLWVPYFLGLAVGFARVANIFDYIFDSHAFIYQLAGKHGIEDVLNVIYWMLAFMAIDYSRGIYDSVSNVAIMFVALPSWLKICGLSGPVIECTKALGDAVLQGGIGKQVSGYLYSMAVSALEGNSFNTYKGTIYTGYIACLLIFWAAISFIPKATNNRSLAKTMWILSSSVKLAIAGPVGTLENFIRIGIIMNLSLAPMMDGPPLGLLTNSLKSNMWSTIFGQTVNGFLCAWVVTEVTKSWPRNTRPGFMWYLGNPDKGYTEIAINYTVASYIKSIVKSALAVIAFLLTCVTIPVFVFSKLMPGVLINRHNEPELLGGTTSTIFILIVALGLAYIRKYVLATFKVVFTFASNNIAHSVRLTEYITGRVSILDEGHWTFNKIPWMPIPLSRLLMPTQIVEGAFKQATEGMVDMANPYERRGTITTKNDYAHIQKKINEELANSYPYLNFTLQPNNMRVPAVNNLQMYKGRMALVPVDDDGQPLESIYDYESADSVRQRLWAESQGILLPPSALYGNNPKELFKSEDYCVVYVPPMQEAREFAYTVSVLVTMSTIVTALLLLFGYVGRCVLGGVGFTKNDDILGISIGLIVSLFLFDIGCAVAKLLTKLYHENSSFAQKLQEIKQTATNTCKLSLNVAFVTFVFGGVIPALLGMAKELYFTVLYMHFLHSGYSPHVTDTSLFRVALRMWQSNILIILILVLGLLMKGDNSWLNDMFGALLHNPRFWNVRRLMQRWGIPIIGCLTIICITPVELACVSKALRGTLSVTTFWELLMLKDTETLATHIRFTLVGVTAGAVGYKTASLYRACAEIVRNRLHLSERVLENFDGSSNPHFSTPDPTLPTTD